MPERGGATGGFAGRPLLIMMAAICVALTIAPSGAAADAAGQPAPRYDLAAEIAWAHATFPALRALNSDAPVAKLLDWVPLGGSIEAYLYTPDHACMRIELGRGEDDRLSAVVHHRSENPALWPFDSVEELTADRLLVSHPQWEHVLGGSPATTYGALSFADARLARFGGEPLTVRAFCDGPWDWIPCARGGDRPCNRCERLRIDTAAAGEAFRGRSRGYGKRRFACREPCPGRPGAAMDDVQERLQVLLRHIVVWRPRPAPVSRLPALYRFRADCLREHDRPLTKVGP